MSSVSRPDLLLSTTALNSNSQQFKRCVLELTFTDNRKKTFEISNNGDSENLTDVMLGEITANHNSITIYFDFFTNNAVIETLTDSFKNSKSGKKLDIRISDLRPIRMTILPRPIETRTLTDGKICHKYENGISETFLQDSQAKYNGTRIFPDGRKEKGTFTKETLQFINGYQVNTNGTIEFISPELLASYEDESKDERSTIGFLEVEGKMIALKEVYNKSRWNPEYVNVETPIEQVLLAASKNSLYPDGKHIREMLSHKDFDELRRPFIDNALALPPSGQPRLFEFCNLASLDVLETGIHCGGFNLAQIKIFFTHATRTGNQALLDKLVELYPQYFLSIGQEIIEELILKGHTASIARGIAKKFKDLNGSLDTFHFLLLEVATYTKPNDDFETNLSKLSVEQKKVLYNTAFTYSNPFIHEPPAIPIKADQYSINLMWINKHRIPDDQEFILGYDKSSFEQNFILPISKWAISNPGSPINIWVDSGMATNKAIKRSELALEEALNGTNHGIIHFRDVRKLDVVARNPLVFSDRIPIYFRVDLLRAAAADHTLSKKETQYFVYGDLDMAPLSGQEIFDKRTVDYLDDFGFVMAKGGHLGFENGFQIINGNNAQFLTSHREVVIDLSIEMANQRPSAIKEQQIYDTYPAMVTHFLNTDGRYGKLALTRNDGSPIEKFSLSQYRFDRFNVTAHTNIPFTNKTVELKKIMPTKPVSLPPSRF